jgi:hypothetical protein
VHFHEQGFRTLVSKFFRGLLHHYRIELQNLNPNLVFVDCSFCRPVSGLSGHQAQLCLIEVLLMCYRLPQDGEEG